MSKHLCPRLIECFWCGEEFGIAIPKKLQDDCGDTSPIVVDYEPCDKCREKWEDGDVIIEAQDTPLTEGQPPMQEGAYPTGHYWVVKKGLIPSHFAFITKEMAEEMGLYNMEAQDDTES